MKGTNVLIRVGMAELNIRQYQAAKILGISEGYLSKILREELPQSKQYKMLEQIREGVSKHDENN